MSKRNPTGIVRADVEVLRKVQAWLSTQPGITLECDVLTEVIERAQAHATNAALVRVRIKNAGTPPSERMRRARLANMRAAGLARTNLWQESELNLLRQLVRDGVRDAVIAEQLGRTEGAVATKRQALSLQNGNGFHRFTAEDQAVAIRAAAQWRAERGGQIRNETAYQRARRVMAERRQRERMSA